EDGIRDFHVTGVQTCALPIFDREVSGFRLHQPVALAGCCGHVVRVRVPRSVQTASSCTSQSSLGSPSSTCWKANAAPTRRGGARSEERRVGKECRSREYVERE